MDAIVNAWRKVATDSGPFIFPGDAPFVLPKYAVYYRTLREYRQKIRLNDTGLLFQVGLLPVPYLGNLSTASVFLLLNNPGLGNTDYETEFELPDIKELLRKNLRQALGRERYPFICLNPAFSRHAGFAYWEPKFRSLLNSLSEACDISEDQARRFVSREVAVLQLVPYHSRELRPRSLLGRLPSTKSALSYVHDVIVPRAISGKALVVALRGHEYWALPENTPGVLQSPRTRSFSIAPHTVHGEQMLAHLVTRFRRDLG